MEIFGFFQKSARSVLAGIFVGECMTLDERQRQNLPILIQLMFDLLLAHRPLPFMYGPTSLQYLPTLLHFLPSVLTVIKKRTRIVTQIVFNPRNFIL
jgi:hypothetical protein